MTEVYKAPIISIAQEMCGGGCSQCIVVEDKCVNTKPILTNLWFSRLRTRTLSIEDSSGNDANREVMFSTIFGPTFLTCRLLTVEI